MPLRPLERMHHTRPITVNVIDPTSAEWDKVVRGFDDHTVFHTSPWLQCIAAAHGARPGALIATLDTTAVAVWPYLEMRKGPFRVVGSPLPGWSTAYMGPLMLPGVDVRATLRALLSHRELRRYAYFACRTIVHRQNVDLSSEGFALLSKFETYWIDLTLSENALWEQLKSECRSRIRKSEKQGVEIRCESDGGFLEDFWRMSLETFAKSRIQPTHTREFCEQVWRRLHPLNGLLVLSAFIGGRRAATLMLPFDAHTMYYWGGASYQEFRDVPANNLLHWHAIREARMRGLRCYDFVSSEGGPGRFKKTFGPRPVDMARHWERSPSRLLRRLKEMYYAHLMRKRRVPEH